MMKASPTAALLVATTILQNALGIQAPTGFITRTGDQSVVLHWEKVSDPALQGYRVYRSLTNSGGPFTLLTSSPLTSQGYCDLNASSVINGQTNYYYVTAMTTTAQESAPSATLAAVPHAFASDDEFLDYLQATCFDYFWYLANPNNGLVPDRTANGSDCSIAAVGFGLSAICVGIDHGWISRTQGVARVLTTLNTFLNQPQGTNSSGVIGYKGWFYHFLNMNTALRSGSSELSSIDTALLLGGILHAKQYFNGSSSDEASIRSTADAIFGRIDWNWMAQGTDAVAMGWQPGSGFTGFGNWIGYDEGMIIYILGLGATNPLPSTAWNSWTSGYTWATNYGQAYVPFPPMFGHQYSHCWIDFRHAADSYMTNRNSTYFENSRRASLAQVGYATANPNHQVGYSSTVWGLTACDTPSGYGARGAPPGPGAGDDGTIAPTAAGGSIAFVPEYSIPTLRAFYSRYRARIWTAFAFRDSFNLGLGWYDTDELGIDQGPMVIMIENYRTQRVWNAFMKNPEVERGLQRAGFVPLSFVPRRVGLTPDQSAFRVAWAGAAGRLYQVEYSPDLSAWFSSPTGEIQATNTPVTWLDIGPPATVLSPFSVSQRFYRVFQYGAP